VTTSSSSVTSEDLLRELAPLTPSPRRWCMGHGQDSSYWKRSTPMSSWPATIGLDAVRGHPFEMAVAGRQQSDTIWRQRLDDEHSGAELSDDQGRPTLHAGKPEILSQ
jgi:hypothetical protein